MNPRDLVLEGALTLLCICTPRLYTGEPTLHIPALRQFTLYGQPLRARPECQRTAIDSISAELLRAGGRVIERYEESI